MNMPNELDYCEKHECNKELFFKCKWICNTCISESLKNASKQHEEIFLKNLLSRKISNAHIPLDLKNKDLNNFLINDEEDEKIVDLAKRYMEQIVEKKTHLNLMITGPTGVGKSHIAVGILKYCYELKYFRNSVSYSTSFGLANKVIATWSNPDLNEEDVLKEYTEIDLLIIDDLGYGDIGKKAEIINKIIYRRHENQKSTIITSNLKANQVLEYMDSRTCSRFLSHLYSDIQIDTEDFRLKRM
ncbi:ATP-binding protein [Acinetobacter terrestris]|nr:ATP-binding protein [Acinetobacter terrestris]